MLVDMQSDTTITITRSLHERLAAAARAQSATIEQLLSGMMNEHDRTAERATERGEQVAVAIVAMRSAPPEVMEEHRREFRAWEATNADGLKGL